MRMQYGDIVKPVQRGDQRFDILVEGGNAVPKNIDLGSSQQKSALVNGKGRNGLQTEQTHVVLFPLINEEKMKDVT